jgi:hypothetical protein
MMKSLLSVIGALAALAVLIGADNCQATARSDVANMTIGREKFSYAIGGASIQPASSQQTLWCTDEASGGYIVDPDRPVGQDKSRPQAFIESRFPLTLDGMTAKINLQGLKEESLTCARASPSVLQCIGQFKILIFDNELKRFNLAQVEGYVANNRESLVIRLGQCR